MPSSKYIDKSNDYVVESTVKSLVPTVATIKSVVTFTQWYDQNYTHLCDVYATLQEMCHSTGRYVFDADTCDFNTFCAVAYQNSYKYKKHDPNYDRDDEDPTVVTF